MHDNHYQNMLRRHANDAAKRAERWEKLAKDSREKGFINLAICAAKQARRCRQEAARK